MSHFPDFATFQELAREHQLVPVWRCLFSDALTPVTAFHRIDNGRSACLFESVIGGEKVGRYSFLAADPFLELSATRNVVTVVSEGTREQYEAVDPLEEIRKRLAEFKAAHLPNLPPFAGGAVGYAGYDVVRYTENLPNAPEDDRGLPDLCFGFYDHMAVFDNVSKTMFVIAMAHIDESGANAEAAFDDAKRRVDALVEQLSTPTDALPVADIDTSGVPEIPYRSNFKQADFEDAVRKCVEYIRAGDIFQVVISQRLELDIKSDPFEIYRTLRVVNPSPFMFFVRSSEVTLVGSSPEIMCRVMDGKVTVR
ncbi:MAG TPA: chorismate-binding protein, partial [Pirellulaceae bacterium]|nr:chorismate-binding protein [Pirellulaceae bacterium]